MRLRVGLTEKDANLCLQICWHHAARSSVHREGKHVWFAVGDYLGKEIRAQAENERGPRPRIAETPTARMTDDQQRFVIAALVVIGVVLVYFMLDWTSEFRHPDWTPIFIFYENLDPFGHVEKWGLYTQRGVTGVILGAVVPLCLFAVAAYLFVTLRLREGDR